MEILTMIGLLIGLPIFMFIVGILGLTMDYWFEPLIKFLGLEDWADRREAKLTKRLMEDLK